MSNFLKKYFKEKRKKASTQELAFQEFLELHELEVRLDLVPRKGVKKPAGLEDCTQGVYLHTIDDPSVGIFGTDVSPSFREMRELIRWTLGNKSKILEQIGEA